MLLQEAQLLFFLKMGFEGTATLTTAQAKAQLDNPLEQLWQTRLCATLKQAGCLPSLPPRPPPVTTAAATTTTAAAAATTTTTTSSSSSSSSSS